MKLASLGHAARNQKGLKVRQPLEEAAFTVGNPDEARALEAYADLLADELNVKRVRLLNSASEAVTISIKPRPKQLGQKHRGLFPQVSQAILALDPESTARDLQAGQTVPVTLEVQNLTVNVSLEDVEIRTEARPGLAEASDGPYLAALTTDLTPELVREGLAREFVRRVQDLRKTADFDIADRIRLYVQATPILAEAIQRHRDYIMGETLSVELAEGQPPEGAAALTVEFDGETVTAGIQKAS
jgi:isoleucyl-tRNA synthetase